MLAVAVVIVLTLRAGIVTSEVVSSGRAALDQEDRHPSLAAAEQARLEYRRGEWNAGSAATGSEFDVEQARIGWRAGK